MRKSALFWFGLVVTALVALGLVVLSSASEANAMRLHGDAYFFIKRQFAYLAVGIVVSYPVFDRLSVRFGECARIGFSFVLFVVVYMVAMTSEYSPFIYFRF